MRGSRSNQDRVTAPVPGTPGVAPLALGGTDAAQTTMTARKAALRPCPHHSHGEPHDFTAELKPCAKCQAAGCALIHCAGCGQEFEFFPSEPVRLRAGMRLWCSIECVAAGQAEARP